MPTKAELRAQRTVDIEHHRAETITTLGRSDRGTLVHALKPSRSGHPGVWASLCDTGPNALRGIEVWEGAVHQVTCPRCQKRGPHTDPVAYLRRRQAEAEAAYFRTGHADDLALVRAYEQSLDGRNP
jgi:hypothetical protein